MIRRISLSLPRSIALDVALKAAATALLVCAVVFALIYDRFATESRRALLATVDTDLAGLADLYQSEGKPGLAQRIGDRLDLTTRSAESAYYRLEDGAGLLIVGNMRRHDGLNAARSQSAIMDDGRDRVLVRATLLRGGLRLEVGRSARQRDDALASLLRWFGVASLLIVASAFAVAFVTAARLRRRVAEIDAALCDVQQGRLSARVAECVGGDELDRLGRDVNLMLNRVSALMAAQRDVTDNIAHETRTPLMQLDASLITALEHCQDPKAAQALDKARGQIRGLLRLYDALLDIATTNGQRGDTQGLSDVDLSAVAESLVELYRASAEEAGIELVSEIAPDVLFRADAMQMSHLMVNLLDNAFKYGASGGYIGFRLAHGPVISVEDRGPGIAEAERATIFRRYHRTRNAGPPGHGLGLALVNAIATRHGLMVRVEDFDMDAETPGARFIVWGETT